MDGTVKYGSLEEAVRGLVSTVESLDDPIQNYMKQSSTIGEDGNVWNGNCPEHNLHDCGRQSKPNWFMNVKNGDCVCLYDWC